MPEVGARSLSLPAGFGAAEVHAHTLASDGLVTAAELVRAAAAVGLKVLCVTDHDTIPDLAEATDVGAALGIDVVRGEELTCVFPPGTHVVGLFLERPIRMHMTVEDTVDAIRDQGGLAVVAHPFMPTYFASMSRRRLDALLETRSVDAVELRHTAPMLPGAWKGLDEYYAARRDRLGAALGAGDSHFGAADIGRVVTVFEGSGADGLRRSMEERTTSPFQGIRPAPPGWRARLAQQQRSMIWLSHQRRTGRLGTGAGPPLGPGVESHPGPA